MLEGGGSLPSRQTRKCMFKNNKNSKKKTTIMETNAHTSRTSKSKRCGMEARKLPRSRIPQEISRQEFRESEGRGARSGSARQRFYPHKSKYKRRRKRSSNRISRRKINSNHDRQTDEPRKTCARSRSSGRSRNGSLSSINRSSSRSSSNSSSSNQSSAHCSNHLCLFQEPLSPERLHPSRLHS